MISPNFPQVKGSPSVSHSYKATETIASMNFVAGAFSMWQTDYCLHSFGFDVKWTNGISSDIENWFVLLRNIKKKLFNKYKISNLSFYLV